MITHTATPSESLASYSRRSLWLALAVMIVLGAYALLINIWPDSPAAAMASRFAVLLPVAIVIAVAALRASLKGSSADPAGAPMKRLLHDELRQQSLHHACRNGLFGVLLAQPLLALVLQLAPATHPVALMASATVLVGAAAMLGTFLAYDR